MAKTRQIKVTISEARAQAYEAEVARLNAVRKDKPALTLAGYLGRKLDPPKVSRGTYSDPKDCHHPPGRRIGNECAQCGQKVGK